ncbi:MAG: selenocysteine-specific translation elongation factor [Thermoanaerobaculia bacterium]|nr:selenocysteine-specific translation elongation factor [Thermoanaerobaculia bacterium]
MKRRIVGTAGHIDHGKTSLVRALTGIDCDRLPEEKRRGITIDLGFAHWISGDLQIGFVDVPGHEKFVKHMLAGVGGIDCALLVVAADESVMPQTREHLAICELLRIPTGVVALTKADLVEPEILDLVRLEVEELVRGTFLEGKPLVAVSSVSGAGLDELRDVLQRTVEEVDDRDASARAFRLPVDRVFTMKGFGTVVTGTTVSGSLTVDEPLEILPSGTLTRARRIHVHGEARERASAGERTSVNLADVALDAIARGEQLVRPGTLGTTRIVTTELELLPDARPLADQTRVRFHHFSSELLGSIRILASSAREIAPGSKAFVQIRLESPVCAVAGDRFVIRRYSPPLTIGGGRILDPALPRLSRTTRHEILSTLASGSPADRLQLLARLGGTEGISLRDVESRWGLTRERVVASLGHETLDDLVTLGEGTELRWIHSERIAGLRKATMEFLASYFEQNRTAAAVPKSELLQQILPRVTDPALTAFVLADLQREKIVVVEGDQVDVPGRSKRLSGIEGDLARTIESRYLEGGLQPPPVSVLIQTIHQKPKVIEGVVAYLVKTGVIIKLADIVLVHKDAVAEARAELAKHKGETIDVGWFKDRFGLSRKIAIPLLEYFDKVGATKRRGDQRTVL